LRDSMGKGCLLTQVDLKTRKLYAARSKSGKRSGGRSRGQRYGLSHWTTSRSLRSAGVIERDTGAEVYFVEPRTPWRRGTNENTNALLRFYFPQETDFRAVTDEQVREVVDLFNHRPRKCLSWLSPEEFSLKCCA
jgi:IS30 family transposase